MGTFMLGSPARGWAKVRTGGTTMSSFKEYSDYDAIGLAELLKRGDVSPLEVTESAIERIERLNPTLNAIVHKLYDRARERARRPFAHGGTLGGVPMLLKDLLSPLA